MEERVCQSFSEEQSTDGKITIHICRGSRKQMEDFAAKHSTGSACKWGILKKITVKVFKNPVWECELRYESNEDWEFIAKPEKKWGEKWCELRGALLAQPLENHPGYRTHWNHALAAENSVTEIPAWWESSATTVIPDEDKKNYRWCREPDELPENWHILKMQSKPGVEKYDTPTYSVVEYARFHSAGAAGKMAAALNCLGKPSNTFGISAANWRCDDADISWNGKYWTARICWLMNSHGAAWDSDLYQQL